MLFRLTLLILAAFAGACSSGGGSTADLRAVDLEGDWLVNLTTTSLAGSSCNSASAVGNVTYVSASITVAGSIATVELDSGSVIELDLVGSRAVGTTVVSFVDSAGLTNRTETSFDLGVVGTQMTGSVVVVVTRGDGTAPVTLCREESVVSGERKLVPPADFGGDWDIAILVLTSLGNTPSGLPYVRRLQLVQEAGAVIVSGYGSLLSPDNNGSVIGIVTRDSLRLTRNDGFTDLTLTMDQDGCGFRGAGWVRFDNTGGGVFGGGVFDAEVLVTASPSFPTTAQMWINFENGLWDASSNDFSGQARGDFAIDTSMGAHSDKSGAFDGVGDGVRVCCGLAINVGEPFSFGVWAWPESHGPYQTILAKRPGFGVPTGGLRTAELYLDAGQVVYGYSNGETVFGNMLPIAEWSHIGVVYDGVATHTIYVNGVEASTNQNMPAANEGQNGEAPWSLTVGQASTTSVLGYLGNLDDVTYWARSLSKAEMQVLHSTGPVGM